jgi:hypothetical protein
VNPTGQRDGLPDVRRAQFIAMMRTFHLKQDSKSNAHLGRKCR